MRFAAEAAERRGTSPRTNRNMLVFLAPDAKRLDELLDAARHDLAWSWVDARWEELDLTPQRRKVVASNRTRADEDVTSRILGTYH
jgi:hypothetical protein